MRLFPEVKRRGRSAALRAAGLVVGLVATLLVASPSFAQYYPSPYQRSPYSTYQPYSPYNNAPYQPAQQQQQQQAPGVTQQQLQQVIQKLQQSQQQNQQSAASAPAPAADLGDINDPGSAAYKANQLADQAAQQRAENATLNVQGTASPAALEQSAPPPDMVQLQEIKKYQSPAGNGLDGLAAAADTTDLSLDIRRQAQREAALSYGARGGLAKRNFEIMEQVRDFGKALDRVFNFRALLIRAPSGLLIEPPIIDESDKALIINGSGNEAAVADRVYDINQQARIVSAPRDWRQYLIQSWSKVPPPPRVLWPKTPKEQAEWSVWVQQGWVAGVKQADQIFEDNVNRLVSDFDGMVRYRVLLAQNMISAPAAMQEDRGVTGGPNQMRIGDSAIKITDPSQFLKKANLWKPADQ